MSLGNGRDVCLSRGGVLLEQNIILVNRIMMIISYSVLCFVLVSPVNSPLCGEEGPSGIKTTLCPVCEEVIHGNGDELNSHVETCLRKVLTVCM